MSEIEDARRTILEIELLLKDKAWLTDMDEKIKLKSADYKTGFQDGINAHSERIRAIMRLLGNYLNEG
jgi:hypothetical protein